MLAVNALGQDNALPYQFGSRLTTFPTYSSAYSEQQTHDIYVQIYHL